MMHRCNVLSGLVLLLGMTPALAQSVNCAADEVLVPVKGKIFNNALQPGTTLGTVHMTLGHRQKMKCGLLGQGGAGPDGSVNFIHTIVCDDEIPHPFTGEIMHSQLTLNTSGLGNFQACPQDYPPGAASGSFQETSTPVAGMGRGIFTGVERGELQIEGEVNCLFTIDMKFKGGVCLKASPAL